MYKLKKRKVVINVMTHSWVLTHSLKSTALDTTFVKQEGLELDLVGFLVKFIHDVVAFWQMCICVYFNLNFNHTFFFQYKSKSVFLYNISHLRWNKYTKPSDTLYKLSL